MNNISENREKSKLKNIILKTKIEENRIILTENSYKASFTEYEVYEKDEDFNKEKTDYSKENEMKIKNIDVKNMYLRTKTTLKKSDKSIERIGDCSTFMQFLASHNFEHKKLTRANFCRDRFCPICSKILSAKTTVVISAMMKYLKNEYDYRFIFITLTAPNIKHNLKSEIDRYNKAFERLIKAKEVVAINKGYIRKLEVTYNAKTKSYHPHFHVIMVVNKSYFKDRTYINRDRWLELWRDKMRDSRITQVDVRRADITAIKEISKYLAKDNDYMTSESVFIEYYNGLKGKRFIVYGGVFKIARKLFKEGKLDKYIDKQDIEWKYLITAGYYNNHYSTYEVKEIEKAAIEKLENQIIQDIKREV